MSQSKIPFIDDNFEKYFSLKILALERHEKHCQYFKTIQNK